MEISRFVWYFFGHNCMKSLFFLNFAVIMSGIKFTYWDIRDSAVYGIADLKECLGKITGTNGCTALLCTSGCAVVSVNLKQYKLSVGEFLLLPFDMIFIPVSVSANFKIRYISVSIEIFDETAYKIATSFWYFIYTSPILTTSSKQFKLLQNWYDQTEWFIDNCNEGFVYETLKNCFSNLLIGIYSEVKRMDSQMSESYAKNRSWTLLAQFYTLLNRYHHKHRDVKFYVDKMNISSDYLYKLIYRTDGISPKEAIEKQVTITLKAYLRNTNLSVKSIANELNFEDASYMCRFFRKMTGVSPNQFRNNTNKSR